MYPGTDGNPEKLAVRGLSLALPRGECFGMLGPNGAGKTSFISMVSCEKNNMITEAEIISVFLFSASYQSNGLLEASHMMLQLLIDDWPH